MSDLLTYQTEQAAMDAHGSGCNIAYYGPGDWRVWIGAAPAPWQQVTLPSRTISAKEYADRFTSEERGLFVALVESGDALAGQLHESVLARIALDQGIDLDAPRVSAGLDYLVSKGVISPARKTEILR